MATGTRPVLQFEIMAPYTALLDLQSMHGLFKLDIVTLLGSLNRMALNASTQAGMMAGLAGRVVALMSLMIEGYQFHALGWI